MRGAIAWWLIAAGAIAAPVGAHVADETHAAVELRADMNGDGHPDRFAMERRGGKVVASVTFAAGATSKLEFEASDFHCSVVVPDPACEDQPRGFEVFSLDTDTVAGLVDMYDLNDADVFVRNGHAVAVEVQPGDTDSFRFFWNAKSRRLDWLRL